MRATAHLLLLQIKCCSAASGDRAPRSKTGIKSDGQPVACRRPPARSLEAKLGPGSRRQSLSPVKLNDSQRGRAARQASSAEKFCASPARRFVGGALLAPGRAARLRKQVARMHTDNNQMGSTSFVVALLLNHLSALASFDI
jgi:hypothetical protein